MPDLSNTPQKPHFPTSLTDTPTSLDRPFKPHLEDKPHKPHLYEDKPHLDNLHPETKPPDKKRDSIGPMRNEKYCTPPHHPYSRPNKAKPELREDETRSRQDEPRSRQDETRPRQEEAPLYRRRDSDAFNPQQAHYQRDRNLLDQLQRQSVQPQPSPNPSDQDRKPNTNPEHFIFPDCTPDLQKEFFMFYMQKCLQQSQPPFIPGEC